MFVRCSVRDLGEKGQSPVDNWVITLYATLHKPKNIRCVSASAREGDDVSTTNGE